MLEEGFADARNSTVLILFVKDRDVKLGFVVFVTCVSFVELIMVEAGFLPNFKEDELIIAIELGKLGSSGKFKVGSII